MFNFFPGPGVLFKDVLQQVQNEFTDWNNTGMSIVELSHRSVHFAALMQDAKSNLRKLVNIPDEYDVLFVQGGATQVFSSLPMNLSRPEDTVDYVVNGYWSRFAAEEATKHVAKVNLAALDETGTSCPHPSTWRLTPNAAYVHYCSNETIHGCEYHEVPDIDNNVPLVCDMSSDFLSKPIDVRRFGMIYAGAHKNIGPAGMTVIVIKRDLLHRSNRSLPYMLNYQLMSNADSMCNTPPVFCIYFANLVFKRIIEMGGLQKMHDHNLKKAAHLYNALDGSDGFYTYKMVKEHRSIMNVPFALRTKELEERFIEEAETTRGLIGLRGHAAVGHCRASIYNGMSFEGVDALVNFMTEFKNHC